MCVFKVKHSFGHISGMFGPIDVKQKGSASVAYWVYYETLTFDLIHDLDIGFFKVKFLNSCISGVFSLFDMIIKGSELITCWADCRTLPFDHMHDLDLKVSRSEFEIALSQDSGLRTLLFSTTEKQKCTNDKGQQIFGNIQRNHCTKTLCNEIILC